ncbi:orotidine-5'-phosphate decarboxylase [Frigoribacterium sp. CFBP9039]|uniref:orotidine-5'-phosphate decarboxylase n=1 Tax=Frigoribacterium sp. CFBP9029 TaxID=3096541 RepID=UPI002A6A5E5A|nr:orotidine-5'-phosphate decarboxylase [Frigoribacterium sp. CFBP9039]MDY0944991.1 orotidine-5'-phosphate decarboxylase [Frigoribacterium sp. CFBP9039]
MTAGASAPAFGERLGEVFDRLGPLCVGIDPHPYLLDAWRLPGGAAGARDFGLRVVDAAHRGGAGIVKPQVAFYERWGSAGFAALEEVLHAARQAGLLVIGDAKRGDIGSTMDAYGDAWFDPESSLRVDALTVSPYLGLGSMTGLIARARRAGTGVFVLGATSNPEARVTQTARRTDDDGTVSTVAGGIVDDVLHDNQIAGEPRFGSVGLVLGATVDLVAAGVDPDRLTTTPVLAPGFGHQGALYRDIPALFGAAGRSVVVSTSRALLEHGPSDLADAIRRDSDEIRRCLV